jgi:hypothetical protein
MDEPPKPDKQSPPSATSMGFFLFAVVYIGLIVVSAASCDHSTAVGRFLCDFSGMLFFGGLVLASGKSIRAWVMKKWPHKAWPEPFSFLLYLFGLVVVGSALIAVV